MLDCIFLLTLSNLCNSVICVIWCFVRLDLAWHQPYIGSKDLCLSDLTRLMLNVTIKIGLNTVKYSKFTLIPEYNSLFASTGSSNIKLAAITTCTDLRTLLKYSYRNNVIPRYLTGYLFHVWKRSKAFSVSLVIGRWILLWKSYQLCYLQIYSCKPLLIIGLLRWLDDWLTSPLTTSHF